MITYKIGRNLFQQDVTIQLVCEHLKDYFRVPARIKEDQILQYKQTHTKQALLMLVGRMAAQRKENYKHANTLTETHLLLIQDTERCIKYFGGSSLQNVLEVLDNKIIPNLEALTPKADSKFYANYSKKLNDLKTFTQTSLIKIKGSKTLQKVG